MIVDETLHQALGAGLQTTSDEVRYCCPLCPGQGKGVDRKFHLYYNLSKEAWFCHRCGRKGYRKRLLRELKLEEGPGRLPLSEWTDRVEAFRTLLRPGVQLPPLELPDLELADYNPCQPGSRGWNYCLTRGILPEDIRFFQIGEGTQPWDRETRQGLLDRVIFPDYWEGHLVYWVARLLRDPIHPREPRYRNPSELDAPRGDQVFNLGRARGSRHLIICEGPVSAICGGRDCVATYSKTYSRSQLLRLLRQDCEAYYVAYDGDALPETLRLAQQLHSFGRRVFVTLLPEDPKWKDPAALGRTSFREQYLPASFLYEPSEVLRALVRRGYLH